MDSVSFQLQTEFETLLAEVEGRTLEYCFTSEAGAVSAGRPNADMAFPELRTATAVCVGGMLYHSTRPGKSGPFSLRHCDDDTEI